ncbi:sugar ABC transporter substrate-binding protein (plasmid) [Embleya sp. NBC_00888]|uniref:sugar ABC transporter substrate-binding protein n=1 Tax=Embleya sp. NBC_00888 TaxID=2975960 RepID=UPI002F91851C|nr:sugar ABC transporter substrate-binding protein [Embleya sp. NBC_00888]
MTTTLRRTSVTAAAVTTSLVLLGACGSTGDSKGNTGTGDGKAGRTGVVLPLLTSPFWQAYNGYVPGKAKELGLSTLPTVNSNSDAAQQITDLNNLLNQGVKGLVVAPIDSAAIAAGLDQATRKGVPVVAVDVAPDKGRVAMIVRADNRAYGTLACKHIGDKTKTGTVLQIMGDLSSINGRDRSEAFRDCMKQNHPQIRVLEIPTEWKAEKAAAGLTAILNANPDLKGIYMQAGGVFLAPTLQQLKAKGLLHPVGDPKHITVVSNDGIPQELDAIRRGDIDATVSQPADDYAEYGLFYVKAAMEGKTFGPGPTDHNSTIVQHPNGNLEDQLAAPLITKDNVDDPALWGNSLGK